MEGARVAEKEPGIYSVEGNDLSEQICFEPLPHDERQLVLYAPHAPAFQRLVKRTATSGVHNVRDADVNVAQALEKPSYG